jgi:hypothetical protein
VAKTNNETWEVSQWSVDQGHLLSRKTLAKVQSRRMPDERRSRRDLVVAT